MSYGSKIIGTIATLIVPQNTQRLSVVLVNADTNSNLYIGPDSLVTTASGFLVTPEGTFGEDSGGNKVYCGDIYGVAGTSVDVRYWERIR